MATRPSPDAKNRPGRKPGRFLGVRRPLWPWQWVSGRGIVASHTPRHGYETRRTGRAPAPDRSIVLPCCEVLSSLGRPRGRGALIPRHTWGACVEHRDTRRTGRTEARPVPALPLPDPNSGAGRGQAVSSLPAALAKGTRRNGPAAAGVGTDRSESQMVPRSLTRSRCPLRD
jgi:hypothetical protein